MKNTLALYGDLLRPAFAGAIADLQIPPGIDEVDVRVACHREQFGPSFSVSAPGADQPLATYSLESSSLSDTELATFVEADLEWLPNAIREPQCGVLVRPLEVGDHVSWRNSTRLRRGKINRIRHIASGELVEAMSGFDPRPYHFVVAREIPNGAIDTTTTAPGDWQAAEVYLS